MVDAQDVLSKVPSSLVPTIVTARGQYLLITCQRYDAGGLEDYVLLTGEPIPGDRKPYWVSDDWVDTGGQSRLASVPLC